MSEAAKQLISLAVGEFDRIVLILREDFGFPFSVNFAGHMLNQWFDSKGYLYSGAHLRNLPWMIAYFGPSQSLFGQLIGGNSEITSCISQSVPQANIADSGRLEKGASWYRLDLQCLHHKVSLEDNEGTLRERLALRIQDFTHTNEASEAPVVYRKLIEFEPERFEALIHTSIDRAKRNELLLNLAREIAAKWGYEHVIDKH